MEPGPRTLRTARAILQLAAAEIAGKLSTLAVIVGAARLLPLPAFGAFSVALGAGAIAAVLPSWGFDTMLIQRGAGRPEQLPALLAELLALRLVVGTAVLAGAGAALAALDVPAGTAVGVVCVLAACLAETVTEAYRAVAVARERQSLVARTQLVQRGATAALAVAALLAWHRLLPLSVGYLAGTLVGTAAAAAGAAQVGVRPRWTAVSWPGVRRLVRTSWPAGVHSVASMALFRCDAVLLAALAGAAAAGRYAAAYRLLETVVFVCWTVARAVFPVMAAADRAWRVRRGAEEGLVVLTAAFLPYAVLLWCRGGDLLRLLYGEPFVATGRPVVAWLAPAPLLFGAGYLAGFVLLSAGPTASVLAGSLGGLAVNVGLNLALIPRYGPAGAAAATSLSYAVQLALLYPPARRRAGRPALVRPLLPALAGSALLAGVLLVPLPLGPALAAGAAGYLAVWYGLASRLDGEQVRVIRGVWPRRQT